MSDPKPLLLNVNLKVTSTRLEILKALMNASTELTVTEIVQYTKGLSFGTVYTVLGQFEKAGLVRKFKIGNHRARYSCQDEPKNCIRRHCIRCGGIQLIQHEQVLNQIIQAVDALHVEGFDLILHQDCCQMCACGTVLNFV